eukprot:COSAG01_NODE_9110_length_2550_cov_2.372501_3_plen_59_part_00
MKSYLVTPIGGARSLSLSWVDVPTTAHGFPHSGGLNSTLPTARSSISSLSHRRWQAAL